MIVAELALLMMRRPAIIASLQRCSDSPQSLEP